MKPVCIVRHEDWINAGHLAETLNHHRIPNEMVAIDRGEPLPDRIADISGLAFLGGTMSVNDPLPWIARELDLIRDAHRAGLPVLGHCFGSQLIAKALGAAVLPMPAKEIGWHTVKQSPNPIAQACLAGAPESFEIFIWHHEAFTLPAGASALYSSRFCAEQAFVIGNMLATVAHIEVTVPMLEQWLGIYGYDIEPLSESVQSAARIREDMHARVRRMQECVTDRLYRQWLARVRQADVTPIRDRQSARGGGITRAGS